jgi:hypothetical protein
VNERLTATYRLLALLPVSYFLGRPDEKRAADLSQTAVVRLIVHMLCTDPALSLLLFLPFLHQHTDLCGVTGADLDV